MCKCGNTQAFDAYHGLDNKLYISCQNCGRDYDFGELLKRALEAGIPYYKIIRKYPDGSKNDYISIA